MKKNIYTLLIILPSLIFNAAMAQRAGTPDSTFGTNGFVLDKINNTKPEASSMLVQPDNKIVVSGVISTNDYGFISRYNEDGSRDVAFGDSGVVVDSVDLGIWGYRSTVLLPGGKLLVGGAGLLTVGSDIYLKRYLADGKVDSSFGVNGFIYLDYTGEVNTVQEMLVQPDGKILIGGELYTLAQSWNYYVVRFNTNGSVDSTFGTNGVTQIDFNNDEDRGNALGLQSDGKILITGYTRLGNAVNKIGIARLTTTGQVDNTFGTGGKVKIDLGPTNNAYKLQMLPTDGFLICGSQVTSQPLVSIPYVLKFTAGGVIDSSFGVNGIFVSKINNKEGVLFDMVLSGNSIIASGWSGVYNNSDFMVIKLTPDGRLDSTFATNGAYVRTINVTAELFESVVLDNSGRIMLAGQAGTTGAIARLHNSSAINAVDEVATVNPAFNVYPNPAGDVVYITGAAIANCEVALHDYTGKLLMQLPYFTTGAIDISKLPNGVYFISAKTDDGRVSAKRLVVGR